jgi:hypothetical protein
MSGFFSSSRSSRYTRQGGRRLLFVASVALLATASLLLKALSYGAETDARPEQEDKRHIQDFLTGYRWKLSGSAELVSGGGGTVLDFQVPGCVGIIRVGLLPPSGEMVSLFAQTAGRDARVFYVYRGRITDNPPIFAYFQAKIVELIKALGFRPRASSSVVAVSQPQECRLEAALPWSEL